MVKVTPRARIALKSALSRSVEEPGIGLRVEISEQGTCSLFPDKHKPGDQVIEHDGDPLLLIGEDVSEPLDRATIDLTETPEGAQLVIMKPKPEYPVDGSYGGSPGAGTP
jgi:Fe-S cluster assembly iron-binding protein IscA